MVTTRVSPGNLDPPMAFASSARRSATRSALGSDGVRPLALAEHALQETPGEGFG